MNSPANVKTDSMPAPPTHGSAAELESLAIRGSTKKKIKIAESGIGGKIIFAARVVGDKTRRRRGIRGLREERAPERERKFR